MTTTKFYDITKKEEEIILSLFRIPLNFFGNNDEDDEEEQEDEDQEPSEKQDGDEDNQEDEDQEPSEEQDGDEDNQEDEDQEPSEEQDDDESDQENEEQEPSEEQDDNESDQEDEDQESSQEQNDDKSDQEDEDQESSQEQNDDKSDQENNDKDSSEKQNDNESDQENNDKDSSEKQNDNESNQNDKEKDSNEKDNNDGNKPNSTKNNDNIDNKQVNNQVNDNNEQVPAGAQKNSSSNDSNKKTEPQTQKSTDEGENKNSADKAREMKPRDASVGADKGSATSSNPKSETGKDVPGVDKALGAKNGLDAIKNAKDDPMGAIEKGGTELAKQGAKAVGNAIAPGAGEAVAKAIEGTDKVIGKTELGRQSKKACCLVTLCCSCLSLLSLLSILLLPILLLTVMVGSIFGTFDDIDEDEPEKNFVEIIQEETLADRQTHLTDIYEDALKEVGWYKQKKADENGEDYEDENGSSTIIYGLMENYSISRLKFPLTDAKPEDYPEGQEDYNEYYIPNNSSPYFSMEKVHMPLFQEVLDNKLEKDYKKLSSAEQAKANTLKKMFDSDSEIIKFIDDDLTKELDKEYKNVFNPTLGYQTEGETLTLRDLFEETSTVRGDAEYDIFTVSAILGDNRNSEITKAFYELQEKLVKVEVLTYMQSYRRFNSQMNKLLENNKGAEFPDLYFSEEFFAQFSTISDVATFFSLATLCDDPSVAYEIAKEQISIYKDPIEVTTKTIGGKKIAYIPVLKTWYADYTFDLIQSGDDAILQCTGCTSKSIDEQSWEDRSNILTRYNIDDKEQFFILFMEATGIDPVEGEDNIYSPAGLDSTWQTKATFNVGSTKAYSSGVYSYTNYREGSFGGYKSTETYLNSSGSSFPVASVNATVSKGFLEPYSQNVIDTYGTGTHHRGIDYSVVTGTPVLSIKSGTVTKATYNNSYGFYVEVKDKNGNKVKYAHGNGTFNVKEGDTVVAGTQLMESGNSGNSTGPHTHVEVSNSAGELVDPNVYMNSATS